MPRIALLLAFPFLLPAQPVPKGPFPPVVFVNGYQLDCTNSSFGATFGNADFVLQSKQIVTRFFDNCALAGKPSIEGLGIAFGQFLSGLRFTDGSPVTEVDVVAHSMGGLVVRSYLAGKQDIAPATFQPPANARIRKLIFLATPHFGTRLSTFFGVDKQSQELTIASQFLFDLNTWNDSADDLRGVDALAVIGNGGTGVESFMSGFDDGLATLTSASLSFARPGRTRIVFACHSNDNLVRSLFLCRNSAPSIALILDANNIVGQIIVSFLTGTNAWQSLGEAIEANPLAPTFGGLYVEAQDQNGVMRPVANARVMTPSGTQELNVVGQSRIAWSENLPPAVDMPLQVTTEAPVLNLISAVRLPATTMLPKIVKPGPAIARAIPAAGTTFPLNVAPGQFIAIYGSGLSSAILQATALPFPKQLADVQVFVNGVPASIQYASPGQINIVYPGGVSGLTQLTVQNVSGKHTINLLVAPAAPVVFSLDGSGTGPAAALNGVTGKVVGVSAPLHAGDYLALFLTGLGQTTVRNGLEHAQIVPTVSVGGQSCTVTYAGRAPTLEGVDQINCVVPAGISGPSVPVIVTSNGRGSNTVIVAVQ